MLLLDFAAASGVLPVGQVLADYDISTPDFPQPPFKLSADPFNAIVNIGTPNPPQPPFMLSAIANNLAPSFMAPNLPQPKPK